MGTLMSISNSTYSTCPYLGGRKEGGRTDLLELPVPYAPAQKTEQEL